MRPRPGRKPRLAGAGRPNETEHEDRKGRDEREVRDIKHEMLEPAPGSQGRRASPIHKDDHAGYEQRQTCRHADKRHDLVVAQQPPSRQVQNEVALAVAGGMLLGISASGLNSLIDDLASYQPRAIARVVLIAIGLVAGTAVIRRAANLPSRVPGSRMPITMATWVFSGTLMLFVVLYLLWR